MSDAVQLTVEQTLWDELGRVANAHGLITTELVNRALSTYVMLLRHHDLGDRILIERPQRVSQVTLP